MKQLFVIYLQEIFYYNEDDFKYAKELQKLSGGLSIAKLYDASRDGLTD